MKKRAKIKTLTDNPAVITEHDAKEIIQQKIQKRIENCEKEIRDSLQKYNCMLEPRITVTSKGNFAELQINAL